MVEFKDYNGNPCSLQASSLALYQQPGTSAVWIGIDGVIAQALHGDARRLGVKTDATCGWVPYPIPEEVQVTTRMHLDVKQIKALITHLQAWLENGNFEK